jgi:hypothetical protein
MLWPTILLTWQPWWVQVLEKPLNSPAVGWVTTTFWSEKILPPPTGMSEVVVSPLAEPEVAPLELPDPLVSVAVELLPPHAASSGSPIAETPANPARVLRETGSGVVRSVTGFLSGEVRRSMPTDR